MNKMGGLDQNPMNFFLLKPIVGKDISIPEELVSNKTWNNVPPSQANPGEPPMIRLGLKIFPYIVYVLTYNNFFNVLVNSASQHRTRAIISHHYFQLTFYEIFNILNDLPL